MASTPPHQQEQANPASSSLGQRIPSAVPPVQQPTTFNGRTYHHLPPHLAALVNNQSSLPAPATPQRRGRRPHTAASRAAPTPVSLSNLLYIFF